MLTCRLRKSAAAQSWGLRQKGFSKPKKPACAFLESQRVLGAHSNTECTSSWQLGLLPPRLQPQHVILPYYQEEALPEDKRADVPA